MDTSEVLEVGALTYPDAALRTHLRAATPERLTHRRFDGKESVTQLKVVVSVQHSPGHRSQREIIISDDETRLLGVARPKNDPEAVPILKPGARKPRDSRGAQACLLATGDYPPANSSQSIPSGFRPRNTLTATPITHQVQSYGQSLGSSNIIRRKRNQLDVEARVGDNVKSAIQEPGQHVTLVGESRAKRQKLGSPHNPEDKLDPPSSNDSDILLRSPMQTRNQDPRSQMHADCNRTSVLHGNADIVPKIGQGEYLKIQRLMDSTVISRNKAKPRKTSNTGSSIQFSPDASPIQTLLGTKPQFSKGAPPIPSGYRGTAQEDPSIIDKTGSVANEASQHDFGEKSRYFPNSHINVGKQLLRNQFQDCNGKRRTSDIKNLSSDELEGETTVGNFAVVNLASPNNGSRPTSPAKNLTSNLNSVLSGEDVSGLSPSTIPITKWTGSKGRRQGLKLPSRGVDSRHKEKESWGIDLVSISTKEVVLTGPDLGLDFVEKDQIYYVKQRGKKQDVRLHFEPNSIRKATLAKGCAKLRIEFCGNKKIDIEMPQESQVSALVNHIQQTSILSVEWKPSEWMDKAFKKRLAEETHFCSKTPGKAGGEEPKDIQMAKLNKKRRDDAPHVVETNDQYSSKRPRTRLLDVMRGDDNQNARVRTNLGPIDIKDQIDDITSENSRRLDQGPLDCSRFSRRIHRGSPNPHLSGSRIQPERHSRPTRRLWTLEKNAQKVARSQPVDLGPPWKKPLLYPKYGKKKASVEFSDLERLEETEFLNDNLIGFYLRYLEQRLEEVRPDFAEKVYFFNTFFYASLTNTQRGKKGINYEAVQKWTRSIDIFAFDYVVVPINESSHWYLAIICNLPAVLPDFAAIKSSPETKDACSPHHDQWGEDSSSAAATSDDRLSSPIENESKVEPNLEDQAPTTSFAEMSLKAEQMKDSSNVDRHTSGKKANDPGLPAEGQGKLDSQIKDGLAQPKALAYELAPSVVQNGEGINVEVTVSSQEQKVEVSVKKRKRKSAPPITRMNPNSPAIITFDSLGLTHSPTVRILKDYLRDEGRAKRGLQWEEVPIRGVTAKEIPLQDNFCDCGLFLLGYVDKFLDEPKEFTSKILARQYDVKRDWPRLNPSMLRVSIRQQLMDLHKDQVDDQRESAKKADKYYGKEQNVDARSHPKEEIQVDIRPASPPSSQSTPPRRQRSLSLELNPRRGITHNEALKNALEIGAPESRNCIDSSRKDDEEGEINSREDSCGSQIEQVLFEHDLDSEPDNVAAKRVSLENDETRQLDAFQQLHSPRSVFFAAVGDQLQTLREISRVVEDSQSDSVQEILSGEPPTSLPRTPIRNADHDFEQDRCRSPSTVGAAEKRAVSRGPQKRPSKAQKQREFSVIELD